MRDNTVERKDGKKDNWERMSCLKVTLHFYKAQVECEIVLKVQKYIYPAVRS